MYKYETEESLIEKVQSGEYGWREYISHHSRELNEEYETFCQEKGLNPNNETIAAQFMEAKEQEMEEALMKGEA